MPKAQTKVLDTYFLGRQHMTSLSQIPGGVGQVPLLAPLAGVGFDRLGDVLSRVPSSVLISV